MVMHFATSDKVACGRNSHNLISGRTIEGVTCKTCRNSEAFRAAVAAANTAPSASVEPFPVVIQVPAATVPHVSGIAFGEWLRKLGNGQRLPRGHYFAGKQTGESSLFRAYQVGGSGAGRVEAKASVKPLKELVLDADTRSRQWLADGSAAEKTGRMTKAERCFQKAQFWRDRATELLNQVEATGDGDTE